MPKAGFIVARVSFLVLAASMLGAAMLAVPAAGQTSCGPPSGKCFAVTVSPSSATAGASASFTFKVTNEASTQMLGSVQISAPAGFTITGALGGPSPSFTSSAALFQNLSVNPSASINLTVTATVSSSGCTYTWPIAAHQSNEFNGPGNVFQLDPNSANNLNGTITGQSCHPCTSSTCSSSASSATTSGTVTTSSAEPGDTIQTEMESKSSFNFSCGGTYTPVSDVFHFAVFNAAGAPLSTIHLTGTLRIDKSLVNSSTHPGASSWQICYASAQPFTVQPGTAGPPFTVNGVTFNTGLLPDCSSTQGVPPCVQSRNKNNAGDVVVGFLALGDPYGHG